MDERFQNLHHLTDMNEKSKIRFCECLFTMLRQDKKLTAYRKQPFASTLLIRHCLIATRQRNKDNWNQTFENRRRRAINTHRQVGKAGMKLDDLQRVEAGGQFSF